MENLMGKLDEKISAQEMIKANTAAEAAHRQQIEDQNKHYEEEIRLLRQNAQNMEERLSNLESGMEHRLDDLRTDIVKRVNESDEATHDVGVRIYRNVQASVIDEQKKQMEEIREDLHKQMEAVKAEFITMAGKIEDMQFAENNKSKGLLPLTVIVLLASIANLVLVILRIIGLI